MNGIAIRDALICPIKACWADYPGCILDVDGESPERQAHLDIAQTPWRFDPGPGRGLSGGPPPKPSVGLTAAEPNFGHPKLKEHRASVIALMGASSGWDQFLRNMNRALPKQNETIEMPLDD